PRPDAAVLPLRSARDDQRRRRAAERPRRATRPHPRGEVSRDRRRAAMTRAAKSAGGAAPRTDYPPFGGQTARKEWTERLADVTTLRNALDLLIDWRRQHDRDALEEADV